MLEKSENRQALYEGPILAEIIGAVYQINFARPQETGTDQGWVPFAAIYSIQSCGDCPHGCELL